MPQQLDAPALLAPTDTFGIFQGAAFFSASVLKCAPSASPANSEGASSSGLVLPLAWLPSESGTETPATVGDRDVFVLPDKHLGEPELLGHRDVHS